MWRCIEYATRSAHAPPWLLPLLSIGAHVGSYAAWLPWPLCRVPMHRHYESALTPIALYLPIAQPPAALSSLWLFYAAVPLLLPPDYPAGLPGEMALRLAPGVRLAVGLALLLPWLLLRPDSSDFFSAPYACAGRSLQAFQCIHAVLSEGTAAWRWSRAAQDVLGGMIRVSAIVGLAAIVPRQRVRWGLTRLGQRSLASSTFCQTRRRRSPGRGRGARCRRVIGR